MSEARSVATAELSIHLRLDSLEQLARVLEALREAPVVTAVTAPPVEVTEPTPAPAAPAAPRRRGRRPRAAAAPVATAPTAEAAAPRRRGRRAIVPPAGGAVDLPRLLGSAPLLQQKLVQFLAEYPGQRFTTDELLDPMGVTSRKMLGGRLTGFKKTLGQQGIGLVKQRWLGKEYEYWMEPEDAEKVRRYFAEHPLPA
ncbi:MAG: hypothetical protein HY320_16370 [Armatimonadetes bacterium]|nr:hypothetical protein [Armatimonadota bacterium]